MITLLFLLPLCRMRTLSALALVAAVAGECSSAGHRCTLDPDTELVQSDGTRSKRESLASTSTCSHVYCTTDKAHPSVRVHHHNDEVYGNKIVCRPHLHVQEKCGCECYDESLGIEGLTGDAADLITVPPENPVDFDPVVDGFDGGGWSKVYDLNIPSSQNWDVKADVPYLYKDDYVTSDKKMTHVAYLMIVDQEWVWVSYEQKDIEKTGVPVNYVLDANVHSMNIYTNRGTGLQNGTLRRNGKVEFWNNCYSPLGGNNKVYDHDDTFVNEKILKSNENITVTRKNCYGSMQVHQNKSLVFALNGFSDPRYCDIEIGDDHGHKNPDGTYANNCDQSYRRHLQVFARIVPRHVQDWETLEHTGCGYDDSTAEKCTIEDEKAYVDFSSGIDNGQRTTKTDHVQDCQKICGDAGDHCDGFSYDHSLGMCFYRKKSLCNTVHDEKMSCYRKKEKEVTTPAPTPSPTKAPQEGVTNSPTEFPTAAPTKAPTDCTDIYSEAVMAKPWDGFVSCANEVHTCVSNEWMAENCRLACGFCSPTASPTRMPTPSPTHFPTPSPTKSAKNCVSGPLKRFRNFTTATKGCEVNASDPSSMTILGDNNGNFEPCIFTTDHIDIASEAYSHIDVAFHAAEASTHTEYENIRVWLRFDNMPFEHILTESGEFSKDLCLHYPWWPQCTKVGFYRTYDAMEQPSGFAKTVQVRVEIFNYGGGHGLNDKRITLKELDVLGICSKFDHTRDTEGRYTYDHNKNKAVELPDPHVILTGTAWKGQTGVLITEVRVVDPAVMYEVKLDSGVTANIRGSDLTFNKDWDAPPADDAALPPNNA